MQRLYHGGTEEIQRGTEKVMILGESDQHDSENPYSAPQADVQARPIPIAYEQVPPQLNWKLTVITWLVFIFGYSLFLAAEYLNRSLSDEQRYFTFPDIIWFGFPLILGCICFSYLWIATNQMKNWIKRIAVLAIQALIGFFVYLVICLNYILSTGLSL